MKVKINDIELYYQKFGTGHPIILLHDYFQDGSIFDKLIAPLSLSYTVYVPDLRGYGMSQGESTHYYQTDAEDMASFIRKVNIKKPYVLGFGSGGNIALALASQYPNMLKKLIVAGTYLNDDGIDSVHVVISNLRHFVHRKQIDHPRNVDFNFDLNNLKRITIPTLAVVGEKDWVKVDHVRAYSDLIDNGRLIVMPRQTHDSYLIHSLKCIYLIKDFCK
ncbi:alpha/beta fold hydrolase [Lactobacillus iners]|uniref:alpha/beta fold hydrolase n=1 Tax=Lactobacillus iners TaxID=147802 RepID=UPI003EBC78FC